MSLKLLKLCSVAVLVLLVFAALGPAKWVPRSGLGWRVDHFVGYFAFTLMFCLAWPRPLVIGGGLMALAVLLEGLQAFTPDRHADLHAALISAGGAMAAVLPAHLLIQAPRRLNGRTLLMLQRFRPRWPFRINAPAGLLTACQPVIAVRLTARSPLKGAIVFRDARFVDLIRRSSTGGTKNGPGRCRSNC